MNLHACFIAGRLALGLLTLAGSMLAMMTRPAAAQQTADVIRGRVTGPDGQPIANVQVTAVSYFGGITKATRTGRDGRFSITYPNGEGDYWLSFAAIGFQATRFEVKRRADEEVLLADTKLSNAQQLQTVTVQATGPRQTPDRNQSQFGSSDVAGNDRYMGGVVAPDQMGNLAALAAAMPGVQLIPGIDGNPDRFSIFGLDGSQNNTSLNGQQNGLSSIPRDANVSTQLRAGYDVANGGFSGAQIAITQQSGNNYISRSNSGDFNAPQAQWNDHVGRASEYSSISLGGRMSGPIVMDKDFYTLSYQFDRRSQNLATLLSATPVVFQSSGIAVDSAMRLRSILNTIGVPAAARGFTDATTRTTASLLGGFDWAPKSPTSGHAFNLSYNGSFNDAGPQSAQASQTPASLSESRAYSGGLQLRHTNYLNAGLLTESQVSVSGSRNRSEPLLDLPGGSVLVTSTLDDGTATVRSLAFGGGANASTSTGASLAGRNMLSWFSRNNKHRLKFIAELRYDRSSSERATNLLGRYTYQSLADLEAGRPSSFSRSLNTIDQSGDAIVGALALGDAWRPTADVQVQYGVRVDGNRFLTRPDENPAVKQAFGVSNTLVPNRVYVSPRIGFSWLYGQAPQIPFAEGFAFGPRATIRAGIGVFQNVRGPDLITSAIGSTGLPGSAQQLMCTGTATPIVDWDVLRAGGVPTECADGTSGTPFANSAPSVTLFAPGYSQEKSLRSNISWSGAVLDNRFTMSVNAQYSYNFHQADALDLNFRPTDRFALSDEGGRPVYVLPTSIDPRSGLIASRDARVSDAFNAVNSQRSDLSSQSRQLSFTLSPLTFMPTRFRWSASYTYLNLAQQFRGFASTGGNPLDVASSVGSGPQHDLSYTLTYNLKNALTFSWIGRLTSGSRFTPTIAGDVNGDGRANDRAFVFDPASTSDAALGSAMRGLLENASGNVRDCLQRQIGRIASRNSCVGPWTAGNTTLRLTLNPSKVRLPQRTTLGFTISNPIGAADLLLHGENRMHGWGQTPFLDQSLLFVRGFDAANQRYKYEVNQRFGSARASQTFSRTPVVLTMQMGVDLAPTRDWQVLRQNLDRGRSRAGAKLTEPQLRQMSAQMFPNPMARMLQTAEQLHLTRKQADSLATMSRRYTRLVDSLWTPAAKELAALPKEYDRTAAQARLVAAREKAISYLMVAAPTARDMLTKGQARVLSSGIANMLEPRYLELLRNGMAGGVEGAFFVF